MNALPKVTKNLLIINLLVFVACFVAEQRGINITAHCGLFFTDSPYFRLWQPITYMFLHGGLMHIFFNMFALWMFGRILEHVWGPKRFLIYYMVCGLGAALTQEVVQWITYLVATDYDTLRILYFAPTIGASGAIYGILLAFARLFPNERLFIFPIPMPIKAKWFITIFIVIELLQGIGVNDNVAHFAHLGGMIFGYLLISYWKGGGGSSRGQLPFLSALKKWVLGIKDPKLRVHRNVRDAEILEETDDDIAHILDKIKRSGYEGLTADEKRRLFENQSKRQPQ